MSRVGYWVVHEIKTYVAYQSGLDNLGNDKTKFLFYLGFVNIT